MVLKIEDFLSISVCGGVANLDVHVAMEEPSPCSSPARNRIENQRGSKRKILTMKRKCDPFREILSMTTFAVVYSRERVVSGREKLNFVWEQDIVAFRDQKKGLHG